MSFKTKVGSLNSYEKGSIDLNDDLRHYAFPIFSKWPTLPNPMSG